MRQRGKAGILELVLWDVILVVLVGALAFISGKLQERADATPAQPNTPNTPDRPDAPPDTPTTPPDSPDGPPPVGPTPDEKLEARAKTELAKLDAQADVSVKAGRLEEALAVYEQAPPWLKTTHTWRDGWPRAQGRINALLANSDLLVCLKPQIQLAADRGRAKTVKRLLASVPAAHRSSVEGELSWARTHAPKEDGLRIRGFSPDQVELKGQRCSVDCQLGRDAASRIVGDVDAVIGQGSRLVGKQAPTLEIQVFGSAEGPIKASPTQLLVYQRPGESVEQLLPRVRLAAAQWVVRRAVPKRSHLRTAVEHALSSTTQGKLTAEGAAQRRLLLAKRPDGSGEVLLAAVQNGGAEQDPTGARLWGLVHFALAGTDPAAVELKTLIKKALRTDERALQSQLTPMKAAGLEPVWLKFLERA